MRLLISSIILFTFIFKISAQEEFKFTGLSYTINPEVGLKNPTNDQLSNVKMDLSEFKAFFLVPFRMNEGKTTILAGIDYNFLGGPLDNLPADRKIDANLHALRITTGLNQRINRQWAFRILLMPTLASDFSGTFSSEAFTLQASAVVRRITKSGFRFGLGAAYTNGFGEPKIVPIGEVFYKKDNFDLLIVAPVQAAIRYHFKDFFVGFRVDLQGNEYALNADNNNDNFLQLQSIKFSRYNLGPNVAWTISQSFRLQLSGGLSIKRKLTAINVNNESLDYGLENGAYIKAGIFFGNFKRE